MPKQQQKLLYLEFLILFAGVPLLLALYASHRWKLAALWLFATYALYIFKHTAMKNPRDEWNWPAACASLRIVLVRAAVFCSVLTMVLLLLAPGNLLSFPLERTGIWLIVMFWYPVLSALPQEVIYRSLYHHRYAQLFKSERVQLAVAGLIFGWAHIIFMNWLAVVLCTIGGVLFSHTYLKYKSLALAWIEHSIYGCFLFTIGIGSYFYGIVR